MKPGAVRHVQVIAAHCTAMGALPQLDTAAQELHVALTDPQLGGCRPRTGDHPSLLVGDDLTPERVGQAVDAALREAKAHGAVLVLALLGHGFTPPQRSELYFMVGDSTIQSPRSAVDVGRLLTEAADEPGLDGLIALVDTCHAGGAMPDVGRLAGGVRAGRSRLALLSAAAADQPARDLSLSVTLTRTLRAGIVGAGPALYVDRKLADALRDQVSGQVIGRAEYDQDPFPVEGLWLARNAADTPYTGRDQAVGPLGIQDLAESVELWRGPGRRLEHVTPAALRELRAFVDCEPVDGERDPAARAGVEDVVTSLLEAVATKEFLTDVLADSLTTDLLRSARRLAGFPAEAEGAVPLRDLLEYAALRTRRRREARWKGLARIVTALFHLAELPKTHPRLQAWARRCDVLTEVNDAYGEFAEDRQRRALRLVISLAGAWTEWPEELDVWLVRGGELPLHQRFPCEADGSHGVARAIGDALHWARGELPNPELLEHIDIAAPASLLARWHPEEEKVGRYLLGARYSVLTRWSGRLDEAEDNADINDAARKALRKMASRATTPVQWVDPAALHDRPTLEYRLSAGQYDAAVGIDHVAPNLGDVLELLLPFAPIVLWPRGDARLAEGRLPELIQERWHQLPYGLTAAYRNRWAAHQHCTLCLGDIRAVWHDEAWLEFCRPFEYRVVCAPKEEA